VKHEFKIGGMWECPDWHIELDHTTSGVEADMCPHCRDLRNEPFQRSDGTAVDWWVFTCPRVVVAFNEGGYCTTGVCLDCILDAAKGLK
jgi:hypothetical protein